MRSVLEWGLLPVAQDNTSTDARNGAGLSNLLTPERKDQCKRRNLEWNQKRFIKAIMSVSSEPFSDPHGQWKEREVKGK